MVDVYIGFQKLGGSHVVMSVFYGDNGGLGILYAISPPLSTLKYEDVQHLKMETLTRIEKQRKPGPNRDNRRKVTKMLFDLKYLCSYLTKLIVELGRMEPEITLSSVDRMFGFIAPLVLAGNFFCFFLFN
jgi:hypothetical protein